MTNEISDQYFAERPKEKSIMEWVHCPICGNKTRVKVRNDTVLLNFPLHCPKCKNTNLIEVKDSEIIRIG